MLDLVRHLLASKRHATSRTHTPVAVVGDGFGMAFTPFAGADRSSLAVRSEGEERGLDAWLTEWVEARDRNLGRGASGYYKGRAWTAKR